jgi:Mg/Co/Ni transporter MgtE
MDLRVHAREAVVCFPTNTVAQMLPLVAAASTDVCIVIDLSWRPLGIVTAEQLAKHEGDAEAISIAMSEVMGVVVATGFARSTQDAVHHMENWDCTRVAILDESGRVTGVLHREDLVEAIDPASAHQVDDTSVLPSAQI